MAIRGISSYTANIYNRSASSSSNQLASLLSRSAVNKQMLKKAYEALAKSNGKSYLNRTDTAEDIVNKYLEDSEKYKNAFENAENLTKNTASMYTSSSELLSADRMSDEDFIKSVKSFAENYNNTVNTLKESDNYVAVSSGINMVNTTRSYSASLERAGITVNDDNTLTVDENVLKNNISHAKSMFEGRYSFGGKMSKKASDLQTISKLSGNGAGIYNRYGIFYGSGN